MPERVLVICAHPDDVDFGAAGTVAAWTKAGVGVEYCLVTSGDAGSDDRTLTSEAIAEVRIAEQRAAAEEVGVTELHLLGYRDGYLEVSLDLRRDLTRVIRKVRPDLVVAQSPERNLDRVYASHPDHLAAGAAAVAAVYPDARNPRFMPELLDEGYEPHAVPEMWLMAGSLAEPTSRVPVDITDTFDAKVAALRAHTSQTSHRADLEDMLRSWAAATAQACGLPEGRLAEVFRRVDTR